MFLNFQSFLEKIPQRVEKKDFERGENDSDDSLAYGISCKGFTMKQNVVEFFQKERNWAEDILYLCTFEPTRGLFEFSQFFTLQIAMSVDDVVVLSSLSVFICLLQERERKKINYFEDSWVSKWSRSEDKKTGNDHKNFPLLLPLKDVFAVMFLSDTASEFYFLAESFQLIDLVLLIKLLNRAEMINLGLEVEKRIGRETKKICEFFVHSKRWKKIFSNHLSI